MLQGSYNSLLVLFSLLVAVLAAYTSLDMAHRIIAASGRAARCWLAGGAFAMGLGIWSMHFIGMLAFSLPIRFGFDLATTLVSLSIAVASSAFALWLVCQKALPSGRLAAGALLLGLGIASMHYVGMGAMQMHPGVVYDALLLTLSIVIAVAASGVALKTAFSLSRKSGRAPLLRAGAAVVMGAAIVGMHYTGMAAASFPVGSVCGAATGEPNGQWVAVIVIIMTLSVSAAALSVSVLDDIRLEARRSELQRALDDANGKLSYLALHDALTSLPNRVLLEDRLRALIGPSEDGTAKLAVMFMDLDGFKPVNDAYGHQTGDRLLVQVAERLSSSVSADDTVARMGGDEFVLLLPGTERAGAEIIANRLLEAVKTPFIVSGYELRISTSIGIAMCPAHGRDVHDVLMHADAAMYRMKSLGRDGYCFYEPSMKADAQHAVQLSEDLRHALERRQLTLLYQPQFAARGDCITSVEALLRWSHPTLGLLGPDQFLPVAEKNGMSLTIGAWVLDEACRQAHLWVHSQARRWNVAVNLSPTQFLHPGLPALVRTTLERHALDARHLTIEVAESTAMRDIERSLRILQELSEMGVRISIDDFGSGRSSLLYLKRLPASELKIDRTFVRQLANDADDSAIFSSVLALGRTLGIEVVAKGVETSTQRDFLTRAGCGSMQGFLLGTPVAPADLGGYEQV